MEKAASCFLSYFASVKHTYSVQSIIHTSVGRKVCCTALPNNDVLCECVHRGMNVHLYIVYIGGSCGASEGFGNKKKFCAKLVFEFPFTAMGIEKPCLFTTSSIRFLLQLHSQY